LQPLLRSRLEFCDDGGDVEAGSDRPLGVLFVGGGEAEIGQHAVAHEFGDEPVIARDRARRGLLIGANDLAHVLGIEPGRERSRADEVAEHHGELAALGGVGRDNSRDRNLRRGRCSGFGSRGGRSVQLLDRGHDLAPMADNGDADILEILDRQLRQHRVVDFVFAERRLVLRKAEAPQPNPEIHPRFLRPPAFDDGLTRPQCP
jgi:hypothetical protein